MATAKFKVMRNPNNKCRIRCSAYGCDMKGGTNELSEIRMYLFPRNPVLRRRWELATRRADWKASNYSRLCCRHFITGKPSKDPNHPDYVPSIFVFDRNEENLKSTPRQKGRSKTKCSNPVCHKGTYITTCGIKGFCSKCFSSESVATAFTQSLAPVHQTLGELMNKLKEMEEERQQLRNELALCREEIYHLHEANQYSGTNSQAASTHSKPNSSVAVPSTTTTVNVTDILETLYSDEPDDAYDPDVLPSRYMEQIYDQPNEQSKSKRQRKQLKETDSDEVICISDQSASQTSPKMKRMKTSILKPKVTSEPSPKDGKSSDTGSPITIVYLKR